jgi:two-component system NtrC family sensor kinase
MTASILIVDDSLTVRMDLAEAFQAAGLHPLPAATLAEARDILAREPVALAVLDVMLPDGDGLDLLRELRTTPGRKDTPILVLSSEAEVKDRVRGLRTGANDYVGKPYDTGFVIARARELLRPLRTTPAPDRSAILIIDDSPTFREALRQALEGAGHAVVAAPSGEEGLRLAGSTHPTAIVVDSVMTGIDGATVIRQIRLDAALHTIPCVLLTGSESRESELRALDAGADAFVRKDEDMAVILARIAAVLRSARGERDEAVSGLGPKRILAADDSPAYLQELASMLREEGYDVVLARSGEEALELLAVQTVDCILLDLLMPGLGGQETCRRIKSAPAVRDIPLVLLTSVEDRESMIEGLAAGADDYISKSNELSVLKARVRAQIRRKQFEDEHRRMRDELLKRELEAAEARAAREVAEARASLVEELERKNTELEAFSYSVSHDLRAPLRSIDGFSQALLEDCADQLDETGKRHLERVRAAARRMDELIEDLLSLSKVGRAALVRGPIDLAALARMVTLELQRREPDRAVEVIIPASLPVEADNRLMMVLLENLMGNAWKFAGKAAAARIEVGLEPGDKDPAYFVRDNGAGFDMTYAERLFRPFQRLHSEAEFPGTGIGLATVHRIVDRHGGRVWAKGAPGEGATFYFTLPANPRR